MTPAQRRYLLVEQGLGSVVVNFALNAAIAWLMFRGVDEVPLWGQASIGGDTIGTSFFLPLITCLVVTRVARGAVRTGHVAALDWTRATHPVLRVLPRATLLRGLALGAACAAVVGPLATAVFAAAGLAPLRLWPFVVLKAGYAAALGLVVTPVLALWAITEAGATTGRPGPRG